MSRRKPGESDAWLAPRVHATLRLTRRRRPTGGSGPTWRPWSAAGLRPLAVAGSERPQGAVAIDRFVGDAATNAFSRLWWAAELTRNGARLRPDGQDAVRALVRAVLAQAGRPRIIAPRRRRSWTSSARPERKPPRPTAAGCWPGRWTSPCGRCRSTRWLPTPARTPRRSASGATSGWTRRS